MSAMLVGFYIQSRRTFSDVNFGIDLHSFDFLGITFTEKNQAPGDVGRMESGTRMIFAQERENLINLKS